MSPQMPTIVWQSAKLCRRLWNAPLSGCFLGMSGPTTEKSPTPERLSRFHAHPSARCELLLVLWTPR